jgi:hypothetical protein
VGEQIKYDVTMLLRSVTIVGTGFMKRANEFSRLEQKNSPIIEAIVRSTRLEVRENLVSTSKYRPDRFYPSLSESVSNCIIRCTLSSPEESLSWSMFTSLRSCSGSKE